VVSVSNKTSETSDDLGLTIQNHTKCSVVQKVNEKIKQPEESTLTGTPRLPSLLTK